MRVPNCGAARIPRAKLVDYLLSETHSVGKWKARWFRALGYDESNANLLEAALLQIVLTQDVAREMISSFGTKYVVRGQVSGPTGLAAWIETVWIIETGEDDPRFVTAYPASGPVEA